jgi:hypothetical protein
MAATLAAIEVTGMIDGGRHLHLDTLLPISGLRRVRVGRSKKTSPHGETVCGRGVPLRSPRLGRPQGSVAF